MNPCLASGGKKRQIDLAFAWCACMACHGMARHYRGSRGVKKRHESLRVTKWVWMAAPRRKAWFLHVEACLALSGYWDDMSS